MSTIEHTTDAAPAEALEQAAEVTVSVVIPCLNEEENIEACVTRALSAMSDAGISGASFSRMPCASSASS